jgi:hypothetical protein
VIGEINIPWSMKFPIGTYEQAQPKAHIYHIEHLKNQSNIKIILFRLWCEYLTPKLSCGFLWEWMYKASCMDNTSLKSSSSVCSFLEICNYHSFQSSIGSPMLARLNFWCLVAIRGLSCTTNDMLTNEDKRNLHVLDQKKCQGS